MRTDIPAFYSDWFYNRIRAGYFVVRNPYNDEQVVRHSLSPNVTDLLMFCTKNPEPMLNRLDILREYKQSWNVTVTPYGSDLEPNVPPKSDVISAVQYLSRIIGSDRIGWRYDPIVISERYTVDYHIDAFRKMSSMLCNAVSCVIISFVQIYPKLRVLAPFITEVSEDNKRIIVQRFSEIAAKYKMRFKLCAEPHIYDASKVDQSGCETSDILREKIGSPVKLPNVKPKRPHCACYLGIDMGSYNCCPHLCRYCYANNEIYQAAAAYNAHDPDSPILIGGIGPAVKTAVDKSYRIDGLLF